MFCFYCRNREAWTIAFGYAVCAECLLEKEKMEIKEMEEYIKNSVHKDGNIGYKPRGSDKYDDV